MTTSVTTENVPQTPSGLNHLVLNVRDLEQAHRFWTEHLGFKQVGTLRWDAADGNSRPAMRFYSGELDGKLHHHDIALVQESSLPADRQAHGQALNHVAITYPTREAWQKQIDFLGAHGLKLYGRVARGVTHSVRLTDPDGNEIELVYELPRERWEADIDAALNRTDEQPVGNQTALGSGPTTAPSR
jgi:catechol 2,3-dioxygenase